MNSKHVGSPVQAQAQGLPASGQSPHHCELGKLQLWLPLVEAGLAQAAHAPWLLHQTMMLPPLHFLHQAAHGCASLQPTADLSPTLWDWPQESEISNAQVRRESVLTMLLT